MDESKKKAYLAKIEKKMKQSSAQDGVVMKPIDPERIAKYKEREQKDSEQAMKMIQPHIEYSEDRKHAIIVILGGVEIRGFVEFRFISKIPTADREQTIIEATNEFAEAYLKRKEKTGYERVITPQECENKIQDFYDRCKDYNTSKKFKDSFYTLDI